MSNNNIAPPPVAPPPPPPPSESDGDSVRSVNLDDRLYDGDAAGGTVISAGSSKSSSSNNRSKTKSSNIYNGVSSRPNSTNYGSSYQSSTASVVSSASSSSSTTPPTTTTRPAQVPTITNYGVSPVTTPKKTYADENNAINPMMRGDPHLKPNTGETNDDFGGIGSLRENVTRLRWITIGVTILAIVWEGFAFPARLILDVWTSPASVVVGAYLGIFCLLLLGVELNAPLRDNFGFLYHPVGRCFLLFLNASMCYGILEKWWEGFLGIGFVFCGLGYVYCYIKYPEYRRWDDYNENNQVWQDIKSAVKQRGSSFRTWAQAHDTVDDVSAGWHSVQRETQSLLHQV